MAKREKKSNLGAAAERALAAAMDWARSLRRVRVRELPARTAEYIGNVSAAALVGAVAALIAAGIVRLISSRLDTSALTLLAIGLFLLLVAAVTGYDAIRASLVSRKGFYGFNTTLMILLFLAIASIIIFVGTRNNARFDTTATGEFSLSSQTTQILKDLSDRDQEVEAIAFFVPTDPRQILARAPAEDLLEEYHQTARRFTYRIVDPELQPEEARRFGINPDTQPATIVFSSGGNLQPVLTLLFTRQGELLQNPFLERDFTQAILAVTRAQQKVIYFLAGHGERDLANQTEGTAFGLASNGLLGDNYRLETLEVADDPDVLLQAAAELENAAVLIVAGPQSDLAPGERTLIDDFLRGGGKALFLLDPGTPQGFRDVIKTWGVDLGEGTMVDLLSSLSGNPRAPLVSRDRYDFLAPILGIFNIITQPITDPSFFEGATAVIPIENQGGTQDPPFPNVFFIDDSLFITPLAVTDSVSWLEMDPDSNRFDRGIDIRGPLALGVSIDGRAPFGEEPGEEPLTTQIVVFGDSDFASNRFFTSFGNGDLFLNSVNWLTGDVDLISVRPKLREPRLLVVTRGTFNFIRWSSLLILPIAVATAGVVTWWRRR